MIGELIEKVSRREDLTRAEMEAALGQLIAGTCPDAQMAGLLIGLRVKGETVEELVGAAEALQARAVKLATKRQPMLDTCGTGGDGAHSLNISTMAAFVAAGAGVTVAKHHNRSVSSLCGSADVLERLGLPPEQSPEDVAAAIDAVGIGFLFAPIFHPVTRAVAQLRRQLGVRTLFNMLGPLTNPAGVRAQLVGVYAPERTLLMGEALRALGRVRALVVSAESGLDEIAPCGRTTVVELEDGKLRQYHVTPADFGAPETPLASIAGGTPEVNAAAFTEILSGRPHPAREAVRINAAAALFAAGVAGDYRAGYVQAGDAIDSGRARAKLDQLIARAKAPVA
jgi:anthranilate phosphoribosyltransferase